MRGLAMLLALATEAAARTDDPQATVTKTDDVELLVAARAARRAVAIAGRGASIGPQEMHFNSSNGAKLQTLR